MRSGDEGITSIYANPSHRRNRERVRHQLHVGAYPRAQHACALRQRHPSSRGHRKRLHHHRPGDHHRSTAATPQARSPPTTDISTTTSTVSGIDVLSPFALTTLQRVKDLLFDPNQTILVTGCTITQNSKLDIRRYNPDRQEPSSSGSRFRARAFPPARRSSRSAARRSSSRRTPRYRTPGRRSP